MANRSSKQQQHKEGDSSAGAGDFVPMDLHDLCTPGSYVNSMLDSHVPEGFEKNEKPLDCPDDEPNLSQMEYFYTFTAHYKGRGGIFDRTSSEYRIPRRKGDGIMDFPFYDTKIMAPLSKAIGYQIFLGERFVFSEDDDEYSPPDSNRKRKSKKSLDKKKTKKSVKFYNPSI